MKKTIIALCVAVATLTSCGGSEAKVETTPVDSTKVDSVVVEKAPVLDSLAAVEFTAAPAPVKAAEVAAKPAH